MAKPATSRAPKVYAADLDGVHEWIVAAPNQRAALDALGVHQDLFAQGKAAVEHDPVKVEAARDQPGVPLRRAKGTREDFEPAGGGEGGWAAALKAAPTPKPASRAPTRSRPTPKAAPATKSKPTLPPPRPTGPSAAQRKALRDAEAALRAFERKATRTTAGLDAERLEFERQARKVDADLKRRRAAFERAVDKARTAVANPG